MDKKRMLHPPQQKEASADHSTFGSVTYLHVSLVLSQQPFGNTASEDVKPSAINPKQQRSRHFVIRAREAGGARAIISAGKRPGPCVFHVALSRHRAWRPVPPGAASRPRASRERPLAVLALRRLYGLLLQPAREGTGIPFRLIRNLKTSFHSFAGVKKSCQGQLAEENHARSDGQRAAAGPRLEQRREEGRRGRSKSKR